MNILKRKWIWVVSAWLVGVVMGMLLAGDLYSYRCRKAYSSSIDRYLKIEETQATDAFKESSPIIAVCAEDHLIKYVTYLKEIGFEKEDNWARIVGFAEGRKGRLYEIMGEKEKSSQYFDSALEKLNNGNVKTNMSQLRELLKGKQSGRPK